MIKVEQFYKTMWNPLYEGTSHPQFSYKDLIEFAHEYHQDALKNMESSSRIMSVTKERTYSDNDMLKSFKAGFKYCISRVNPSFKEWLSEYAT